MRPCPVKLLPKTCSMLHLTLPVLGKAKDYKIVGDSQTLFSDQNRSVLANMENVMICSTQLVCIKLATPANVRELQLTLFSMCHIGHSPADTKQHPGI